MKLFVTTGMLLTSLLLVESNGQDKPTEQDLQSASHYRPHQSKGTPLEGLRVAIDVGHSRESVGALSARGIGEFYFNAETAKVVSRVLEEAGAIVILINGDGMTTGLAERGASAMKAKADCLISIHHDSVHDQYKRPWTYEGKKHLFADNFRGYSVFSSSLNQRADSSRTLALNIGEALYETGLRPTYHHNEPIEGENKEFIDQRTGVYEFTNLVVLKSSPMPAILLECGVIVHRDEELLVQQMWYREMIAGALVKSLSKSAQAGTVGNRKGKGGFLKRLFERWSN